jgi:hypothetical protein
MKDKDMAKNISQQQSLCVEIENLNMLPSKIMENMPINIFGLKNTGLNFFAVFCILNNDKKRQLDEHR